MLIFDTVRYFADPLAVGDHSGIIGTETYEEFTGTARNFYLEIHTYLRPVAADGRGHYGRGSAAVGACLRDRFSRRQKSTARMA